MITELIKLFNKIRDRIQSGIISDRNNSFRTLKRSLLKSILIISIIIVFAFLSLQSFVHSTNNWDMLCYTSLIYKYDGKNKEERHYSVYSQLKEKVNSNDFQTLIDSNDNYRYTCFEDFEVFTNQEIFHQSKPLYSGLGFLLYKMGFHPFDALHLISSLSYFLTLMILFFYITHNYGIIVSTIITFIISIQFDFLEIPKLATPDSLNVLLSVSFVLFFLGNQRTKTIQFLLFITSLLLIFNRVENLIFIFPLYVIYGVLMLKKRRVILLLGTLLTSFVILGILLSFYQGTTWSVVFHHSFINLLHYPTQINPLQKLTLQGYTLIIKENLTLFLYQTPLWFILVYLGFKIKDFRNFIISRDIFMITLMTSLFIRFFLYPFPDSRYYMSYFFMFFILMISNGFPKTLVVNNKLLEISKKLKFRNR